MKPSSKKALAWVIGVAGFILVVGIMNANKETQAEKDARYIREWLARPIPPPPPPKVWTPEERIEQSVQRTERMVRDIESKQQAMEREQEWERATRHWNLR